MTVTAKISGTTASGVTGRIVTAPAINSYNTFDRPSTVAAAAFDGARVDGGALKIVLPPKSVVMLDPQ